MTDKATGGDIGINHDAFAEIVRQYYHRVYLAAMAVTRQRDMTEDITQETFLRAWLKRDLLTDPAMQLQPWLVRIATNLSVDWLRRGQSRSRVLPVISLEEVVVEPADENSTNPRETVARQEERGQLEEAILALPDDLRLTVILHYGDDMTASDIARLFGEAPSTVTRRLEKARGFLRQYLGSGAATSLADGAGKLRAQSSCLTRALTVVSFAAAAPAATHAQLLQLVSDTPPPPLIDPVTSAAAAANIQETGFMKSIVTKLGVAKLLGGVALAAALGGGVYGVNQLTGETSSFERTQLERESAARVTAMAPAGDNNRMLYASGSAKRQNQSRQTTTATSDSDSETSKRRLSPQERLTLLTNDTISSQPKVVMRDGETTGLLYFNLEVVDESGLPVKGADVIIEQILQSHRGSQMYGTTESVVQTNAKGIVRVSVPRVYEEKVLTDGLVVIVEHPEYARLRQMVSLNNIKKLVLQHGETLKIFAYDERTSAPIRSGIRPALRTFFEETKLDWDWSSDGAMVIRKINPDARRDDGKLNFYLIGKDSSGNCLISDYQSIKFPRVKNDPLQIALRRTLTVTGTLSANVHSPVKNGTVMAIGDSDGGRCGTYQMQKVDISEDGRFILKDVPPGKIFVWALANGYSSTGALEGAIQGRPQEFYVDENRSNIILQMEDTATVNLTITDDAGAPLSGLHIVSYPNMHYENCSSYWIRSSKAITDANGKAMLFDLPPLDQVSFQIQGDEWEFAPRSARSGYVSKSVAFDLGPGETIKQRVVAYPKGTTAITQNGDQITTSSGTH